MIYIDQQRIVSALIGEFERALDAAADELLKWMKAAIPSGNLPGKPEWRDKLESDIRKFGKKVAQEYACVCVGVPYENESYEMARALLIHYGGGSRGLTGIPIHTKPGMFTWNDDMTGKRQSSAKSVYELPDGFNQKGSRYFDEAIGLMRGLYIPYFETALRNFDFSKYVCSNARSRKGKR